MQDSVKRTRIELVIFFIAIVIAVPIMMNTLPQRGEVVVIDCRLSEISPDFTVKMREACREARAENIRKELQKPK